MDHTHGTKKRALIATTAIFFSRILGLVREQVFAFFFGAGAILDAFYIAFRIPNLLRDLAAEGALSQSFVTIFSQKLARGEQDDAKKLANKTITFIILLMGTLVILGEIFAPTLVKIIATGFIKDPFKFDLTVHLLRILFPYIFFVTLAALLMGILNANKKFFIPFSASTMGNITAIIVGLLCAYLLSPEYITQSFQKLIYGTPFDVRDTLAMTSAITGMALGTLLAGLGQYLFQLPAVWKLGFKPKLDFQLRDKGLITVLKLTGPAVIAGAAVQVNVLVNSIFASLLADGSVSYLQFAFRFTQFPLGVFGVAIAAASAPVLAQMITQKREKDFCETIRSSIQLSLFLAIPSTLGLIILGKPIIALIYQHGHFSELDTIQTSYALIAYSLGIVSYSLIKIYQPAFLAFHDAKTPMRISLYSIFINILVNGFFIFVLKLTHWSLALGTSIVAFSNFFFLCFCFRKRLTGIWTRDVYVNTAKILLAALCMGFAVYYAAFFISQHFATHSLLDKTLAVMVPLFIAVPVYFGAALVLQIKDAKFIMQKILRRP